MKSKYSLNLLDWMAIAFIILLTFWVSKYSDNQVSFFATYAIMSSIASRYQLRKITSSLEKE